MSYNSSDDEEKQSTSISLEKTDIINNNEILLEDDDDDEQEKDDFTRKSFKFFPPKSNKDRQFIDNLRENMKDQYKEIGIPRNGFNRTTFRTMNDNMQMSGAVGFQNSTLSFFNRKSIKYTTLQHYSEETINKWFNNMQVKNITLCDRLCFYVNSLYNNKMNKFKFLQYMGELTMMYEDSNKLMVEIKKMEKKLLQDKDSKRNRGPLYFLHEADDDICFTFRRIDVFLRRHIQFMKLCSAPVDLFLDNYFTARGNSCGLIEIIHSDVLTCVQTNSNKQETIYIDFKDCKDENLKREFLLEMEGSYFEGSDRVYSTNRRVASLHNILGELHAISEFIKTTVDMNDQLLFRLLMLLGSFFMLLGEFVWNTHLRDYYYD